MLGHLFRLLLLASGIAAGQTPWVVSERTGSETRFLYTDQVRSYHTGTMTWSPSFTLPRSGATAMATDETGSVVAYGASIYRYGVGLGGESLLGTAAGSVGAIFLDGNLVIALNRVNFSTRVTIFNRLTGATISSTTSNFISVDSCSHAPLSNRLYSRTDTISGDLRSASYTDDGMVGGFSSQNTNNGFPDATRTWVFPAENRVVDSAGIINSAPSISYSASLAGTATDIAFSGNELVVLRGGDLIRYSASMVEAGRGPVGATTGIEVTVDGGNAFVFSPGNGGNPLVHVVALTLLLPQLPGPAASPNGLAYTADRVFPDKDGNLLLVSKAQRSLFRWSPASRQYTGSFPLAGSPDFASYSASDHSVYLAYPSAVVRKLDLSVPDPIEVPLFNLPTPPRGFVMAGIFPCAVTGRGMTTFSAAGEILSIGTSSDQSIHNTWDPVNRRIYHFRDGIIGDNLLYESVNPNGQITGSGAASTLNIEFTVAPPIRVKPDGSQILLGSGIGFNAAGLVRSVNLSNTISDALWTGGKLATLRPLNDASQLQTWEGDGYLPGAVVRTFAGNPLGLFETPAGTVVVTAVDGQPRFVILDAAFETVHTSPTRPLAPAGLLVGARTTTSVALGWQDLSGNEDGFQIEYRTGSDGWIAGPAVGAGVTDALVTGLSVGTDYEFRVSATGEGFISDPSSTVSTRTLISGNDPGGEPYDLRATRISENRITLQWNDHSANETGFRIRRSTAGGPAGGVLLTAPAGATSINDAPLLPGTVYNYQIQVVNGAFVGDLSSSLNVSTLASAVVPALPSVFTAVAGSGYSVSLTWKDNSTNEDEFVIERSGVPSVVWTEVGRTGFNATNLTDLSVIPDTSYTYRVKAVNGAGSSGFFYAGVKTPSLGGTFTGHAMRAGDVYYFAFSGPGRIERYDLGSRAWLTPIPLQAPPTALWVDAAGILVAEGKLLVRMGLDGTSRTPVRNANDTIQKILIIGDTLIYQEKIYNGGSYVSLTRNTGEFRAAFKASYAGSGHSISPTTGRIFARTTNVSPSEIFYMDVDATGNLIKSGDGPYHGAYPDAKRTFIFPNGARVADESGTVYHSETLQYNNSLGEPFTDLDFRGSDVPIMLRGDRLLAYNNALIEAGSFALGKNGLRVAVSGNDAVVFSLDAVSTRGLSVRVLALDVISAPAPDTPVNPNGLAFAPDDILSDKDGNVMLLSKSHVSLFRWSSSLRGYLPTLPLSEVPARFAYSSADHSAWIGYSSREVRKINLSAGSPVEAAVLSLTASPRGIVVAGGFPIVYEAGLVRSYSADGTNLSSVASIQYGNTFHNEWDPVNRRVFHLNNNIQQSLQYDVVDSAGLITATVKSPDTNFTPLAPLCVSPDGSTVVTGNGRVFNAANLTQTASLANGFGDAAWFGGKLVTARAFNGSTQLQTWTSPGWVAGTLVKQAAGTPLRLLALDSTRLLLVSSINGQPAFSILDDALDTVHVSSTKPLAPMNLTSTGRTTNSVSLGWQDGSDNEDGFRIDYRLPQAAWSAGPTVAANTTAGTVSGLQTGMTYEFRVVARAGALSSDPAAYSIATLADPGQPVGEPYGLKVTRVFSDSITLAWNDNANNETGFRVMRSTTTSGTPSEFMVPPGSTTFTSSGLTAGSAYYFQIQVINGGLTGDLSSQVSAVTLSGDTAPSGVTMVNGVVNSPILVFLTWKDNSSNEDTFTVERGLGYHPPSWTDLGSLAFNSTEFADQNALPDTEYSYRIRAINAYGSSASHPIVVRTPKVGGEFAGHSIRAGDVHLFAFNGPSRIERYDLALRTWLPSIPLQAPATALWTDESGIFVAEDRALVRFNTDGSGRLVFGNNALTIRCLFGLNDILVSGTGDGNYTTLDKRNGALLSTFNVPSPGTRFSVAAAQNKAFFRGAVHSTPDMFYLEIGADGLLKRAVDSPYLNTYPNASRCFVFPDGRRVVDDSGTIYSTESLGYTNSLGGAFTDIAFNGADIPIVLRGNMLVAYKNTLVQSGTFMLGRNALRVSVSGSDAVTFLPDSLDLHGLRVQVVPLTALSVPVPGQQIDPRGLSFTPDDVLLDREGNLLLPSNAHLSLFRWSSSQLRYLPTLPFVGTPDFIDYSNETHQVFTVSKSQVVRTLNLGDVNPAEIPFLTLSSMPRGFSLAGSFPYFWTNAGLMTFSSAGANISTISQAYYAGSYNRWDPVNRRMYHFRDGITPNTLCYDTVTPTGEISETFQANDGWNFSVAKPIRISPDGSKVVVGSGVIFDASGPTRIATLSNTFVDALWRTDQLLTIVQSGMQTRIQRWNAQTFAAGAEGPLFDGSPLRLLALDAGRSVLITLEFGKPHFYILNPDLSVAESYVPLGGTPPAAVEDVPYSWKPTDLWSFPQNVTLVETAPVLPSWLTYANGVLSGTPAEQDVGNQAGRQANHRVVLRAEDSQGNSSEKEFHIPAFWRNDAPVFTSTPAPVTANANADSSQVDLNPLMADPDGLDEHVWEIVSNTNPAIFSGISVDGTGLLRFAYAPYAAGSARITVKVTDRSAASASTSIDITLGALSTPTVTARKELVYNKATKTHDQNVTVRNASSRAIPGFQLLISGLRTGETLKNGTTVKKGGGTFNYSKPLAPGKSVNLVLKYTVRKNAASPSPIVKVKLLARAVSLRPVQARVGAVAPAAEFSISQCMKNPDGTVGLLFPTEKGFNYQIQYSLDAVRWTTCPPVFEGSGGMASWTDNGPPSTRSHPSSETRRFYRVQRTDR